MRITDSGACCPYNHQSNPAGKNKRGFFNSAKAYFLGWGLGCGYSDPNGNEQEYYEVISKFA